MISRLGVAEARPAAASHNKPLRLTSLGMVPALRAHAVQVPHDVSIAQSHLTDELPVTLHAKIRRIHKAKIAMHKAQDSYIRAGPNGETSQLFVMDFARGMPGGTGDHVVDRHTHVQELRHDIEHILHAGVHTIDVDIGGDGIGYEPLLHGRDGLKKGKTPGSMAYVENDAALASFKQIRQHLILRVQHGYDMEVLVRINVAGTKVFQHQLLERAFRTKRGKINHDRDVRQLARLHASVHRNPLGPRVVRHLDADHHIMVAARHFRGSHGVHILGVLLDVHTPAHAVPHNVEHGEYPSLFPVDHLIPEFAEIAPARAARVHHRGDAAPEKKKPLATNHTTRQF